MTMSATKRRKLEAMANQTESPEEAEVARAMLAKSPDGQLETIASAIKDEWGKGIESQFVVGRLLADAAARFEAVGSGSRGKGHGYSGWLKEQDFPFAPSTGRKLRWVAEHEQDVRAFIASRSGLSGKDIGPLWAANLMGQKPALPAADVGPTAPVDPVLKCARELHRLVVTSDNAFKSMHVDDLKSVAKYLSDLLAAYNEARAARE